MVYLVVICRPRSGSAPDSGLKSVDGQLESAAGYISYFLQCKMINWVN